MEANDPVSGFPYVIAGTFMDLFEGLTYSPADFASDFTHDRVQDNAYWSVLSSAYKYGSSPSRSFPCGHNHVYELGDHLLGSDGNSTFRGSASITDDDMPCSLVQENGDTERNLHPGPEECVRTLPHAGSSQVVWQDNIDPDNMTYEELLDLGEVVGTQSRGLPQELISSLPVTKCKWNFFLKKRKFDRCVVCQMEFRRGDKQMTLPCKHIYHACCVSRWLSISKACPICYIEVFKGTAKC